MATNNYVVQTMNSQADRDQAKRILSSGVSADNSGGSSGSGTSGGGNGTSDGTGENGEGDNTSENVKENDPEKNKKLAEITMSEALRETYQLTFKIPRILKGLHTNQFFFVPQISNEFYETNYPQLIQKIADEKFGRYAGFEYGRFFVDKVVEKGGIDGWGMEITVNPIPPSLATYSKIQEEAKKALIQAMNDETKYVGTEGNTGMGGLSQIAGEDCSETFNISTRSFDINQTANHIIGNSSANYATDTASMSGKDAIMDAFNRFSYVYYYDNRTCPQKMWNSSGSIRGNCADISRLIMCIGQVHGMKVGIRHCPNHYYNLIEVDGNTYRFDCCFKSRGYTSAHYGGELCNNLSMNGGPWS